MTIDYLRGAVPLAPKATSREQVAGCPRASLHSDADASFDCAVVDIFWRRNPAAGDRGHAVPSGRCWSILCESLTRSQRAGPGEAKGWNVLLRMGGVAARQPIWEIRLDGDFHRLSAPTLRIEGS